MRLVIADTGPINYLLLIGHIDILPALFEKVIPPAAVVDELKHPKAPLVVRNWVAVFPLWVDVRPSSSFLSRAAQRHLLIWRMLLNA